MHQPLEFLLFSGFAVVVAYVHQLTIFMIVPIFNAMARIDKRVVEAALDAGASRFDIMRLIILPLSKNGIALGSIFVVSIVMGDFFVIKVMSGGGSASVVGALYEDVGVLQYPSRGRERRRADDRGARCSSPRSCAPSMCARRSRDDGRGSADASRRRRRRPWWPHAIAPRAGGRPWTFYVLLGRVRALRARALRSDDMHLHPVVSGCSRRPRLSDERPFVALVRRSVHPGAHRRRQGRHSTARSSLRRSSP